MTQPARAGTRRMVTVRLSASARDALRREAGRRQAEDGREWTLSRVVEALLAERGQIRRPTPGVRTQR